MQNFTQTRDLLEQSSYFYLISVGMDGNYSYTNPNYKNQFQFLHDDLVGKPYHITMHPDDCKICEEASALCFQNPGKLIPATIRKHDGQGGYICTQWEFRAMINNRSEPVGVFCIGYDITELVAERAASQKINEEVLAHSTLLENIVFQQTHTVRAPLTNLIALTRILNKSHDDVQLRSNLANMILETAKKLDDIISDIVKNVREKIR
ncbi:PAS domain-containing protein [Pedobacter sp.]|uniref:PAS domain-containing protein n=1 Tax=Pedobacter sp. TaxID=1411316 RepID=UPI003C59CC20